MEKSINDQSKTGSPTSVHEFSVGCASEQLSPITSNQSNSDTKSKEQHPAHLIASTVTTQPCAATTSTSNSSATTSVGTNGFQNAIQIQNGKQSDISNKTINSSSQKPAGSNMPSSMDIDAQTSTNVGTQTAPTGPLSSNSTQIIVTTPEKQPETTNTVKEGIPSAPSTAITASSPSKTSPNAKSTTNGIDSTNAQLLATLPRHIVNRVTNSANNVRYVGLVQLEDGRFDPNWCQLYLSMYDKQRGVLFEQGVKVARQGTNTVGIVICLQHYRRKWYAFTADIDSNDPGRTEAVETTKLDVIAPRMDDCAFDFAAHTLQVRSLIDQQSKKKCHIAAENEQRHKNQVEPKFAKRIRREQTATPVSPPVAPPAQRHKGGRSKSNKNLKENQKLDDKSSAINEATAPTATPTLMATPTPQQHEGLANFATHAQARHGKIVDLAQQLKQLAPNHPIIINQYFFGNSSPIASSLPRKRK